MGRVTVAMVVPALRRALLRDPAESVSCRSALLQVTPAAVIRSQNALLRRVSKETLAHADSALKSASKVAVIKKEGALPSVWDSPADAAAVRSMISWVRHESHVRWQLNRMAGPTGSAALQSALGQKSAKSRGHCVVGEAVGSDVVGSDVVGTAVGAEDGLHVSPMMVGRTVVGAKVVGASVGASVVGAVVGAGVGAEVGCTLGSIASQQEEAQKWLISRSRAYVLVAEMNV